MAEKVYAGVSGFSYTSWKGKFYPKDLKSEEFLASYSQRLDSVEINSSFYAPPKEAMVKNWSEKTGERFRFSLKAPKIITHIMKLGKGSPEAARRFSKTLDLLGPKRGPVLFQLPPFSKEDPMLLEEFLSKTSDIPDRVFEFRHESWLRDSTYKLLEDSGAHLCIAETEEMKPVLKVTGGLAYFRLRKESYDSRSIDGWTRKIRETTRGLRESYVYLRHDETGANAILAIRLSEKLGHDKG